MTNSQADALNRMMLETHVRVDQPDRDLMEEHGWITVELDGMCRITNLGEDALMEAGEYVVLHDEFAWGAWGDDDDAQCEAARERMEEHMEEHAPDHISISVRPAKPGECAGIYQVRPSGTLQVLGYSLTTPESVSQLINDAYAHACETWPSLRPRTCTR